MGCPRYSVVLVLQIFGGLGCSEPVGEERITQPSAGRRIVPADVCTASASAQTPCSDDPNPCGIDSGFPGDDLCLPPPAPELGLQIHLGPRSYDDADEVGRYLLAPGSELNELALASIPTAVDRYFNFVQVRMRPGSHHLINRMIPKTEREGFLPDGAACPGDPFGDYFTGAQSVARDDPAYGIVAPENEGLGRVLNGDASLCMNQHAYNFGDQPLLREVWINVYFMDPAQVTQHERRVVLNADVSVIPPGTRRTAMASTTILGSGRILNLYGHRHASTERFAVWHNDALIYDSWDWFESVVFEFNSVTDNPPIDPNGGRDGAVSGPLHVHDGDRIAIACEIHNQTQTTLVFSNEIYTGEMCILFGATVGAEIASPGIPL